MSYTDQIRGYEVNGKAVSLVVLAIHFIVQGILIADTFWLGRSVPNARILGTRDHIEIGWRQHMYDAVEVTIASRGNFTTHVCVPGSMISQGAETREAEVRVGSISGLMTILKVNDTQTYLLEEFPIAASWGVLVFLLLPTRRNHHVLVLVAFVQLLAALWVSSFLLCQLQLP